MTTTTTHTTKETTVITAQQVQKVAHLARLKVDEQDIDKQVANLSNILSMIDQINAVDTSNITPMASSLKDATLPLREDGVTEQNQCQQLQKLAPAVESGLYLVPKVIE